MTEISSTSSWAKFLRAIAFLSFPVWGTFLIFRLAFFFDRACYEDLSSIALFSGGVLFFCSAQPIWAADTDSFAKAILSVAYYAIAAISVLVIGFIMGGMYPDHYCVR